MARRLDIFMEENKPKKLKKKKVLKKKPTKPVTIPPTDTLSDSVEIIYSPLPKPTLKKKKKVRKKKLLPTDAEPVTPEKSLDQDELETDSAPGKMGLAWNRLTPAEKVTYFIRGIKNDPESTPIKQLTNAASKHVKNFTPPQKIGTPGLNPDSPPQSMISRSGEKLELVSVFDDLAVYAKTSSSKRELSHALTEKFVEAHLEETSTSRPNNNNIQEVDKIQTYDSTTAATPVKKSWRSQKAVMGISATTVVEQIFDIDLIAETLNKMLLSPESREGLVDQFGAFSAEWLHLIDYAKVGEAGQIQANMIFGSREANSTMMVIESYASDQIKKGHHIRIEVKAMHSTYNVAQKIEITILDESTKTKTQVEINPFTQRKPVVQSRPLLELHLKNKSRVKKSK